MNEDLTKVAARALRQAADVLDDEPTAMAEKTTLGFEDRLLLVEGVVVKLRADFDAGRPDPAKPTEKPPETGTGYPKILEEAIGFWRGPVPLVDSEDPRAQRFFDEAWKLENHGATFAQDHKKVWVPRKTWELLLDLEPGLVIYNVDLQHAGQWLAFERYALRKHKSIQFFKGPDGRGGREHDARITGSNPYLEGMDREMEDAGVFDDLATWEGW